MKMPVLLSGHTMTPAGMLRPEKMQISLRADGLSTASMELDAESPVVNIGDWVQVWAPNGEMCVMYVKNRRKDYVTGNITVTLEHCFGLLASMVVFGEVTAATMSGRLGATTCTVTEAITYLLGQQTETLWALHECDFSDAYGWKFTNSDIHSDLKNLTDAILDCQWEFDQTSLPWKLSLKAWPTTRTMELRRNRNLDTMQITLDRSGMYTRAYPTGKNNLHIDSVNNGTPYIDQNTALYGVIANVITDSTIKDPNLLKAWAQKQLAKNSVPKVSVTISGYELSEATGEQLDHLVIGRICRIPLPEHGEIVTERLSELTWRNAIAAPEAVNCTLANELKTVTGVLNEKAGGGGGGSNKANTEHDCQLKEGEEWIQEFENTDIWLNQDSIWAVCGSYEVTTWQEGGVTRKKLKMKEGTALTIERDHTEYGIFDEGNLTGGIVVTRINDNQTLLKIIADRIDIDGIVTALTAYDITVETIATTGTAHFGGEVIFDDGIDMNGSQIDNISNLAADDASFDSLTVDGSGASWRSKTITTPTFGTRRYFLYAASSGSTDPAGTARHYPITSYTESTIHYLGSADT